MHLELAVRTELEKMVAGELYDPFDPDLVARRLRARDLLRKLNATPERAAESNDRRGFEPAGTA